MAANKPASDVEEQLVICDAGPVIHLDELDCLDLLGDFSALFIPDVVWQEIAYVRPGALLALPANTRQVQAPVNRSAVLQSLVQALTLDQGEQAALATMASYPTAILLTDDAAARLAAQTLGCRVHGTIGILLRAIRRRQRTRMELLEVLQTLPERSSLYIRRSLLQTIIDEVTANPAA